MGIPQIHILKARHKETDVIQKPRRMRVLIPERLRFMKRDVVESGAVLIAARQVNTLGIGLPLHLHFHDLAIKVLRVLRISDIQRDMSHS